MTGTETVPAWVTLTRPGEPRPDAAPSRRRLLFGLVAAAIVVVLVVVGVGVLVARQLAEREAAHDAARTAELLGDVLIEPALSDSLLDGDPAALAELDEVVRNRVLGGAVLRVKLWDASGTIVYSDEPRLIGERFGLDDEELEVLGNGGVEAEVSDVAAPENRYERGRGELLEAYHAVATSSGRTVLFEAYFRYDEVAARTGELWTASSLLSVGSVFALIVLLLPLGRRLFVHLRAAQRQRETLLHQALDASADERRRIAARLHDGTIQELTGSALLLSAAAAEARRSGASEAASALEDASRSVRGNVGALRTLLVDVYPPGLASAGLVSALDDLAAAVRTRGLRVDVRADEPLGLDPAGERLAFRVVRELLANAVRHAGATVISVRASADGREAVLEVADDGSGFDAGLLARDRPGHFGTRLLIDAAEEAGAELAVATAPGSGTRWRLRIPLGLEGAGAGG